MDSKRVGQARQQLQKKPTEELLHLWRERDNTTYTEEGFEAIRQLLTERGIKDFSTYETMPESRLSQLRNSTGYDGALSEELTEDIDLGQVEGTSLNPDLRRALAEKYRRHMLYGILWFAGGSIISGVTYSNAASNPYGGTYVVAWGAIIFGLVDFFRGLSGWMKYKDPG